MDTLALSGLIKATDEYRSLFSVGASLQQLDRITESGRNMADYLCALVPDELIQKYGVDIPAEGSLRPSYRQLTVARGYQIHLFASGNKHLLSNDGFQRYLNADRSPEVSWCGPTPGSVLLFTVDLHAGLLDEMERFVHNLVS